MPASHAAHWGTSPRQHARSAPAVALGLEQPPSDNALKGVAKIKKAASCALRVVLGLANSIKTLHIGPPIYFRITSFFEANQLAPIFGQSL